MKIKFIAALTIAALAGPAFAQSTSNGQGTANAGAQGGAVTFSPTYGDSINRYAASSAFAPQLVAGIDTCMGSSSIGGSATSFSFSIGTTWKDEDCRMIKNGRELYNMGQRIAALVRLCEDDDMNYAIAVSGGIPVQRQDGAVIHVACPMSKADWIAKGRPLLDPATGQPYTAAQLNPPAPQQAAQIADATPSSVASAYSKLTPEQKAAIMQQAKIEAIEAKAHALALNQKAKATDSVASK